MRAAQAVVGLLLGAAGGAFAAWAAAQALAVPPVECPEHPVLEARIADLEALVGPR